MRSMTGFAEASGAAVGRRWRWEARSVNGRGLDLRLRLGDGAELDEARLRSLAAERLSRGSVTAHLRMEREGGEGALRLNPSALTSALVAATEGEAEAQAIGLNLAPATIGQILALRGVLEPAGDQLSEAEGALLTSALSESFASLMDRLAEARAGEGARLSDALVALVDRIEALAREAETAFAAQQAEAPSRLAERVAQLLDAGAESPPERLAQELALLAVKADIKEELDRLTAHIAAARELLRADGPVGRKLDFLTQEFNREVNTICSKSGSAALTTAGLELKVVVDQLREQAQNVE